MFDPKPKEVIGGFLLSFGEYVEEAPPGLV